MKKIIAISMTILMLTALCACGSTAKNPSSTGSSQSSSSQSASETKAPETQTPETQAPETQAPETDKPDSSAPSTAAPDNAGSTASTADDLKTILKDIADNYNTGVSGSSLNAAKYAGQLLDWNVSAKLSDKDVSKATLDFFAELGQDASGKFVDKFSDIYAAAKELCGDTAQDLLDSCGYKAESFPWAEADMTTLFTAIYSGLGVDMPQDANAA